jgi:endonuclease YncB( thermonuclease family)
MARTLSPSNARRDFPKTLAITALCLALPVIGPTSAQTVVDGDSIELNGTTYRLYGIEAPEDGQSCPDGWPAAYEAEAYLRGLIRNKKVTCMSVGLPKPDDADAICRADGVDVGAAMVTGGMAFASVPYSARYISQEDEAAAAQRGVHKHKCLTPRDWRERIDAD